MDVVVAPVLQRYVPPPDAVSVDDTPVQNELFPLIVTIGSGLTVTLTKVEAEQPFPSTTVTL